MHKNTELQVTFISYNVIFQIILITDGEVWNTQDVIETVKKNAHNTR